MNQDLYFNLTYSSDIAVIIRGCHRNNYDCFVQRLRYPGSNPGYCTTFFIQDFETDKL